MRKALSALTIVASVLLVAPAASPASASAHGADRAAHRLSQTDRGARSFRDEVIALTNAKRRAHGCHNLRKNAALGRAAQRHSARMAAANTLSHQLPGEAYFATRITRAGYRNWTMVGENVAQGQPTPAAVVSAWMHSAPHRHNILNCRFKDTGVGYAVSDNGTPYWTQDFGRR